jgi:hypothetical protein
LQALYLHLPHFAISHRFTYKIYEINDDAYYYGDWFRADNYLYWINAALIIYFTIAFLITAWFVFYDFKKNGAIAETISLQDVRY